MFQRSAYAGPTLEALNSGAAVGDPAAVDWRARCLAAEERGNKMEAAVGRLSRELAESQRRVGELTLENERLRRKGGR